jgi:hypothetical protein
MEKILFLGDNIYFKEKKYMIERKFIFIGENIYLLREKIIFLRE